MLRTISEVFGVIGYAPAAVVPAPFRLTARPFGQVG